jgi:hypothetical protein
MGIILKWIFNMTEWCELDSGGSGQGQVVGFCELGNELLDFIKCKELVD